MNKAELIEKALTTEEGSIDYFLDSLNYAIDFYKTQVEEFKKEPTRFNLSITMAKLDAVKETMVSLERSIHCYLVLMAAAEKEDDENIS